LGLQLSLRAATKPRRNSECAAARELFGARVYDPEMSPTRASCALFVISLAACAPAPSANGGANAASPAQPLSTPSARSAQPNAVPSVANATPIASAVAPPQPSTSAPLHACGAFDCLAFASPSAAFDYVLRTNPRVLAVGEAHAQDDRPGIFSSTRRFGEQLLPLLSGKAKHLVIELLLANCQKRTVEAVKKEQAPVTEHQAASNQSEFVTLGKVAQRFGIEPQGLTPECAEYDAAVAGGEDGVARLLALVANQTTKEVEALLAKPETANEIIVTYGGALHNDLMPKPGQEAWSFGPRLAAATQNRYVELDLIVPEFVKDTDTWRNLPWFSAFDREHLSSETLLYRPAPNSFALIFPKTERDAPARL
jgi:hypothetical protein